MQQSLPARAVSLLDSELWGGVWRAGRMEDHARLHPLC